MSEQTFTECRLVGGPADGEIHNVNDAIDMLQVAEQKPFDINFRLPAKPTLETFKTHTYERFGATWFKYLRNEAKFDKQKETADRSYRLRNLL